MAPESLVGLKVASAVRVRIMTVYRWFFGFAKMRQAPVLLELGAVYNGLLTPALKVERSKVLERYPEPIQALYASGFADKNH